MPSDDQAACGTDAVAWRLPWYPLDAGQARFFEEELARELCAGHVLFGADVTALARCDGTDDVLFGIKHPAVRLAAVHLTYQQESDPRWPQTEQFASADDFVRQRMLPDAAP